ncbi:MAG TPA: alpha/beta fold hydrolase [Mycobacterium sp.]|nr:alpha/beta fold hydrolase [Mycobacterium sp.]
MKQYRRGDLTFDYIDEGPADGPVVVLLHGFPQLNTSWNAIIDRLTARGYRCIAPNQRGYSPGARPTRRRDYRAAELVEDVRALLDAVGAQRVHLVGHDLGAAVAWGAADTLRDRVATLTSFSVPHPAAFAKALVSSRQGLASWYMYFFQLPWLPERLLLAPHGAGTRLSHSLRAAGQTAQAADRDVRAMSAPGMLTAALNWYRAIPLSNPRRAVGKISAPTMYVWSDNDVALTEKPARDTANYVTGEYRFEILHGAHWIPDEQPDKAADLLLEWFDAHPI